MAQSTDRYLAPTFDVQIIEDMIFGQSTNVDGQSESLRLDIYRPKKDPAPLRPAILWFHGGGFRPGQDKRQAYIPWFAKAFAARGYVCIAPDYRLRPDPMTDLANTIGDAVTDARMALDWTRTNCREYRIDPNRIALAGGSAGGILILHLCHDAEQPLNSQEGILAILDMWGTPGGPIRLFERVNPHSPSTLIVHGTADGLVPYPWSQDFSQELAQAGVDHELLALPDAPHTPLIHMDQIIDTTARFLHVRLAEQVHSRHITE